MKKSGTKIPTDHTIYPKKLGMFTPPSWAMAFTIKLGAFPIYVVAPKNTAPVEIAKRYVLFSVIKLATACGHIYDNSACPGYITGWRSRSAGFSN